MTNTTKPAPIYTSRWAVPFGVRKLEHGVDGWSVQGPYRDHQRQHDYYSCSHPKHTKAGWPTVRCGIDCFDTEAEAMADAIKKLDKEAGNLRRRSANLCALADKYREDLGDETAAERVNAVFMEAP